MKPQTIPIAQGETAPAVAPQVALRGDHYPFTSGRAAEHVVFVPGDAWREAAERLRLVAPVYGVRLRAAQPGELTLAQLHPSYVPIVMGGTDINPIIEALHAAGVRFKVLWIDPAFDWKTADLLCDVPNDPADCRRFLSRAEDYAPTLSTN